MVLLHGLNGAPAKTWQANPPGTGEDGVYWPIDLLPESLANTPVNILVYGYNADVYSRRNDRSASDNFIFQHAQTLVSCLTLYRKGQGFRNPIIWVAHSLGGILLKRALLYSSDLRDRHHEDDRSVFISTYAIIFLGTPHTGSGAATWGHMLQAMADAIMPKKLFESESVLLKTLKKDNETLQNINNHFLDIYQRFKIHMAHENHKTDLKATRQLIVDAASAGPQLPGVTYYGIEATHSGMCKFASSTAPGFLSLSTAIREWAQEAPAVIQLRWQIENEESQARAANEAHERLGHYGHSTSGSLQSSDVLHTRGRPTAALRLPTSPKSAQDLRDPVFVHPQHFRPNSYFVGREKELTELHKLLLMDPKRRSEGTSAVLIAGMAGSGKTHLARQYVFKHKKDYPGGIYWIRSATLQDMENGFWQIAKTEAIEQMLGHEKKQDLSDPHKMVKIVRNWFNECQDWLIVLDGIRFDNPAVTQFIPDKKSSSLIYTSTERAVGGSHLFDNPSVMELGLLPLEDAQALLLDEMGRSRPHTTDDLKKAGELVQLVDCLPLTIHAAAQQMNATREPLGKYLKSFKAKPRVGLLPAYKTIRDELQNRGEVAALNLIYLLSFFSQHIPVEMLALGLKALDKRTPVKSRTSRRERSLNRTFVVLIAFALVERTEIDDLPSTRSKGSRSSTGDETEVDLLDVLRMHSVVQIFFLSLLDRENLFSFWLERAVSVFCLSFDKADSKMQESPDRGLGLPDDYRRYSIHGKKLMEHFQRLSRRKGSDTTFVAAKRDLQDRLDAIPRKIETLQSLISSHIVDRHEGGNVPHVSIFERSHSMSTQSTFIELSSSSSFNDSFTGDCHGPHESPTNMENPHHSHLPYPFEGSIPALDDCYDEKYRDDKTVTPQASDTAVDSVSGSEKDWVNIQRHRSVKRMEQRRYHDRAGSWRNSGSSTDDPRVGITRESAHGVISPPSFVFGRLAGRPRVTAGSEAEAELMHIKKASPPPTRGGGHLQHHVRNHSSDPILGSWPSIGKSAPAHTLAVSPAPDDNDMSSSAAGTAGLPATTTSTRTAAYDALIASSPNSNSESPPPPYIVSFFQRSSGTPQSRQERCTSLSRGTPLRHSEAVASSDNSRASYAPRYTSSSERLSSPSRPGDAVPVRSRDGTRSANSSPGVAYGPFRPPIELLVVNDKGSSLRQTPFDEQNVNAPYTAVSSRPYRQWTEDELQLLSYEVSALQEVAPDSWLSAADGRHKVSQASISQGYTSQPMSRNPSDNHPVFSGIVESPTSLSIKPREGSRSSDPGHRRPRRVSLVETEPSPKLPTFEFDPTQYPEWQQQPSSRGGRARGSSLFGAVTRPSARDKSVARGSSPGVSLGSRGSSPSSSSRGERSRGSPLTGSSWGAVGSEQMTRSGSGSGGINLGNGRMVEFGEAAVGTNKVTTAGTDRGQEMKDEQQASSEAGVGLGIH